MYKSTPAPFNPYRNLTADIEDSVFVMLINSEVDFVVPETYCNNEESKNLRRYAVQYIEELHERKKGMRCEALMPYTAITYFDRFCSEGDVAFVAGDTETDLCLTCCLIIAWKLRTKGFNLQQFLLDKKLIFTAERVLHMELQICERLKWRIRALTPFNFVNYFRQLILALKPGWTSTLILNLLEKYPEAPELLRRVHQLILTSQCAIAFAKCRPSVVAAGAFRVVSMKMFPIHYGVFESKISASELLNHQYLAMMVKCSKKLEPLYRDPPTPAAGAGPGSSSAEEKPPLRKIRLTLAEFNSDRVNPDGLMNFELGWIEALKQLDTHSADADASADASSDASADASNDASTDADASIAYADVSDAQSSTEAP